MASAPASASATAASATEGPKIVWNEKQRRFETEDKEAYIDLRSCQVPLHVYHTPLVLMSLTLFFHGTHHGILLCLKISNPACSLRPFANVYRTVYVPPASDILGKMFSQGVLCYVQESPIGTIRITSSFLLLVI
ncbi:hypothetical protein OIU84_005663 [Salix udensis]|uniref:Uncharacterized protein n=1 Tax=Salix udensis TaxID=889485 RepID=A0AAD6P1H9_9ROSI|nr:hypothetical protein OIU84_005663 [Salix udensis]